MLLHTANTATRTLLQYLTLSLFFLYLMNSTACLVGETVSRILGLWVQLRPRCLHTQVVFSCRCAVKTKLRRSAEGEPRSVETQRLGLNKRKDLWPFRPLWWRGGCDLKASAFVSGENTTQQHLSFSRVLINAPLILLLLHGHRNALQGGNQWRMTWIIIHLLSQRRFIDKIHVYRRQFWYDFSY